jgi:tRNA modification GTPase
VQTLTAQTLQQAEAELQAEKVKYLLVGNKIDILTQEQQAALPTSDQLIYLSARDKLGLDALQEAIYSRTVEGDLLGESTIVTNERHVSALRALQQSLQDVATAMEAGTPGDLLALDIRSCLHHLGTITGTIVHDEQLDYIFSKFCIGK